MDNVTAWIIGFVVGLVASFVVFCLGTFKSFDDAWGDAYSLGYQHGTEMMLIKNANERKEAELFGEVSRMTDRDSLNEFIHNDTFNRYKDINEFRIEVMRLWNRMRAGELTADLTDKTVTVLAILLDWIDEEDGQDETD